MLWRRLALKRYFRLHSDFRYVDYCLLLFAHLLVEGFHLRTRLHVAKLQIDVYFYVEAHLNSSILRLLRPVEMHLLLKEVLQVTLKLGHEIVASEKLFRRFDAYDANVVHQSAIIFTFAANKSD